MIKSQKVKHIPQEHTIYLQDPVRIYTPKELAVMPLTKMNACIEAQENYYRLEELTQMGGRAIAVRRAMEQGTQLIQVVEKSRTRYRIGNKYVEPRIIRQLEKRGLVKLGGAR